jgi:predicted transcriptional regulator
MIFTARPGLISFDGCHNALKAKTWLFLSQERDTGRWYSAKELHLILGLPLHSLRTHLKRWCDWGRVLRRYHGVYEYRLAAKGVDWLEHWQAIMPLNRYVEEVEAWQSSKNKEY